MGRRAESPPPRILHAPADVGGHAFGLSRAERELGLDSDVAVLAAGPFGYGADMRIDLEGRGRVRQLLARTRLLARTMRSYEIVHFNFGQSLVPLWLAGHLVNELPLLKRAGKTILVTFQGCDVRPMKCCFCNQPHCRAETPRRQPNALRFLRYADRCFHLNPDLARWLPGSRFMAYANVDPRALVPSEPPPPRTEVVVVHAPTDRDVKGTAHVIGAIEALRDDGLPVRLDLIEGVPNVEVRRRLRDADLVVDQLLIGWYGGFAVEAMALGKPVLCHIHEDAPAGNPFGSELPIVASTPHNLVERVRELALDRDARLRIGAESRAFVERRHDPRTIARETLDGLGYAQPLR